ncbi:MAG: hypothetical protein ACRDQ0_04585, partial [Pseudonocardia sp.]
MVTTENRLATVPVHALLSADEVERAREILVAAGLFGDATRVAYLGLEDPVRSDPDGVPEEDERRVRVLLHDVTGAPARDVRVSLTAGEVRGAV